jgi:hypothetical protein
LYTTEGFLWVYHRRNVDTTGRLGGLTRAGMVLYH